MACNIKHPIQKVQTDTIHILGNGSSIELFDRSQWPEEHLFLGCNFSNPELRPDATVMMDIRPFMKFYEGYKSEIPLIISDRCEAYIIKERKGWERLSPDAFTLVDIILMIHDKSSNKPYPMNSGHHATLYGIEFNLPITDTVHLWGFDTFWSNDLKSKTDVMVKKPEGPRVNFKVANSWREYWIEIFQKYDHINFIVHGDNELDSAFKEIKNVNMEGVI